MDELTTRQVAQMLGVSVRTVQLWVEAGALSAWKTPGGHRRITKDSVDALQAARTQGVRQPPEEHPQLVVVEDDRSMQKLYLAACKRWGLTVAVANNGFEGLLMVGEHHPRVVIADLQMPGMDGFEMVQTLNKRSEYADTLVLVVTGLSGSEIEARGGLPEDIPVLRKPVQMNLLRDLVCKQLEISADGGE